MGLLTDKVALITGASSGIGRAAALLFARQGARLVLNARGAGTLDAVVAEVAAAGGQAVAHAGSVAEEATAEALVALALRAFGRLDVAFNNAGTFGEAGPTPDISRAGWDEALAVNLTGAFLGAKHQIPPMVAAGGGSVIFTSTFVGHTVGFPGAAAYAASKSGLIGLTQALAAEFGPDGVRVNAVLPGAVDTPMFHATNATPEAQAFVTGLHALKRVSRPEEVAQAALVLASPLASFQTGTAMLVDGGLSITRT